MKIQITDEQRAGLALWLCMSNWGGTEEELEHILSIYTAARLSEFKEFVVPDMKGLPTNLCSPRVTSNMTISVAAGEWLIGRYPGVSTSATVGPAKAAFLQRLRAALPKKKPEKKSEPGPRAAPPKKQKKNGPP